MPVPNEGFTCTNRQSCVLTELLNFVGSLPLHLLLHMTDKNKIKKGKRLISAHFQIDTSVYAGDNGLYSFDEILVSGTAVAPG